MIYLILLNFPELAPLALFCYTLFESIKQLHSYKRNCRHDGETSLLIPGHVERDVIASPIGRGENSIRIELLARFTAVEDKIRIFASKELAHLGKEACLRLETWRGAPLGVRSSRAEVVPLREPINKTV